MSTRYVWDLYGIKTVVSETTETVLNALCLNSKGHFRVGTSYSISGGVISLQDSEDVPATTNQNYYFAYSSRYAVIYDEQKKANVPPVFHYTEGDKTKTWYAHGYENTPSKNTELFCSYGSGHSDFLQFESITPTEVTSSDGKKKGSISNSSKLYPDDGSSGSNWYVYKGSDSIDPLSVTYSNNRPERGGAVTVTVDAPANTLGGTVSYLYQYSTNGGLSWTTDGAATTEKQKQITVPDGSEQFMARVRAQDDIGFTSADYVSGENLTVQTMNLWVGVNGEAKRARKLWVGVNGVARPVVRGWVGDENGVARRWF